MMPCSHPDRFDRQHRKEAMTRSSRRTPVLLLTLLVLFGLAGGRLRRRRRATRAGDDDTGASSEPVTVRLGYFPNVTHAPGIVGDYGGLFEEQRRRQRHDRDEHVQRRPRGRRGALRRGARRHAHRTEPGHQRLRPVRGRRDPHRVGQHVGRRVPRRARGHRLPRGPRGQEARHPAARQHPGRRAAGLAEGRGLRDRRHRRRRRVDPAAGRTATRSPPSSPATSTAPGCPSPGPPASSRRAAPTCSSTRRDLWPDGRVRHHAPHRAHRVPRGAPRRGEGRSSRGWPPPSTSSRATRTRPRR